MTALMPTSGITKSTASDGLTTIIAASEARKSSPVETMPMIPIPIIVRTPSMSLMARDVISPDAFVSKYRAERDSRWA